MSDVQGPQDQPLFDPPPVRGARKIYTAVSGVGLAGSSEIIWSHGGTVNPEAAETGPPWVAPFNLTLNTLILTLAATTNVALSVGTYRNGVLQRTDSIGTATLVASFALAIPLTAGQTLQPVLLAAATGTGSGLGICYRYTRSA